MHFTPTSSSWMSLVERFFRKITVKRVRRGVFRSVEQFVMAIEGYVGERNLDTRGPQALYLACEGW